MQEAGDFVSGKASAAKDAVTNKVHETGQAASDMASRAKESGELSRRKYACVMMLTPTTVQASVNRQ